MEEIPLIKWEIPKENSILLDIKAIGVLASFSGALLLYMIKKDFPSEDIRKFLILSPILLGLVILGIIFASDKKVSIFKDKIVLKSGKITTNVSVGDIDAWAYFPLRTYRDPEIIAYEKLPKEESTRQRSYDMHLIPMPIDEDLTERVLSFFESSIGEENQSLKSFYSKPHGNSKGWDPEKHLS